MSITKKKMGFHAGTSYCIQIIKLDGVYEPRLVFLFDDPVILESEGIKKIVGVSEIKVNPYNFLSFFCVGYLDGVKNKLQ